MVIVKVVMYPEMTFMQNSQIRTAASTSPPTIFHKWKVFLTLSIIRSVFPQYIVTCLHTGIHFNQLKTPSNIQSSIHIQFTKMINIYCKGWKTFCLLYSEFINVSSLKCLKFCFNSQWANVFRCLTDLSSQSSTNKIQQIQQIKRINIIIFLSKDNTAKQALVPKYHSYPGDLSGFDIIMRQG